MCWYYKQMNKHLKSELSNKEMHKNYSSLPIKNTLVNKSASYVSKHFKQQIELTLQNYWI